MLKPATYMAALLFLAAAGCGTLPRDPEKTLEHVEKQHRMRVGLVENPPWVIRTPGDPAGVEPELARRFAASLGATPEWTWGAEQEHMEALKKFQLDLVIAGVESSSPWAKTIGLTRPYFKETGSGKNHVMATPPGENAWLKRLQEFLIGQRSNVQPLMAAAEGER